jgi:single-stranded-DNA-specific exonuclease
MAGRMKSHTLQSWISRRGLQGLNLEPKLSQLSDQETIADRQVVIDRLVEAVRKGEQICIYTDYDVDGSSAGIILTDVIRRMGGRVTTLMASRFGAGSGYGLTEGGADRVLATGAQVLVTCDVGSSDGPRIARLTSLGIDCLIIDHHLVPAEPLKALAFLNPHRPDCGSPVALKDLCSGGLAFSVACGLKTATGADIDMKEYLSFVALSSIADVVKLDGDNRILVRKGLEQLRKTSHPGLRALMELGKVKTLFPLTGRTVGFSIAPLINAPGRLGSPDILLSLLLSRDAEEAAPYAKELGEIAARRREITLEIQKQAEEQIQASGQQNNAAIVVADLNWNHGVVGITAGRLVDKYKVPVVAIGGHGGHATGSVRGPAGSRLYDALQECRQFTTKCGGHQAAAGLSLDAGQIDNFRRAFCAAIEAQQQGSEPFVPDDLTLRVDPRDSLQAILEDLESLEPCGQGNPRPQFIIEGKVTSAKAVTGNHLSLEILTDGNKLKCFYPAQGDLSATLKGRVQLKGDLRPTNFGSARVEMFVEGLECIG